MHLVIDITAVLILLVFFILGWRKGLLISLLGVAGVIIATVGATLAGRYLGYWLGEISNRPRIVTIPVIAGLTFIILTFIFHITMAEIRARHAHRKKEEDFKLPLYSCLPGGILNTAVGLLTIMIAFWVADLLAVGLSGNPLPGADTSRFAGMTRRAIYEATYMFVPKEGRESQVATFARMVSNPALGMAHLEGILDADSVKQVLSDKQFANDVLSGDPERIRQNAAMQQLIQDKATLRHLRDLGILWEKDNEDALYEKLSRFGQSEAVRTSVENLQAKGLLSTDKLNQLIRDPDFDIIVSELVK